MPTTTTTTVQHWQQHARESLEIAGLMDKRIALSRHLVAAIQANVGKLAVPCGSLATVLTELDALELRFNQLRARIEAD